jgi:hypothetical protein
LLLWLALFLLYQRFASTVDAARVLRLDPTGLPVFSAPVDQPRSGAPPTLMLVPALTGWRC